MIIYNLVCRKNHRFEGWFPGADGYEEQARRRQISCPTCGTTQVTKLPHTCAIRTQKAEKSPPKQKRVPSPEPVSEADAKESLLRLHHYVRENFEDVGSQFTGLARQMHYGKVEKKAIYGSASGKDREGLDEEGIPYAILPEPELDS